MRDVNNSTLDEQFDSSSQEECTNTRYKTILETSMDGFIINDTRGNILEVNNAYCKMTGYSRNELLSMNITDLEVFESPPTIQKHMQNLIHSGSHRFETQHRCKNGKIIELEVSANSLENKQKLIFSFLRDITERKQTEEALRKSEERYRNTMDNMLEGCQIISKDWKYLYVNDELVKQSHKTREQLLGHTMMEVYPGIQNTRLFIVLRECMEKRCSQRIENEFHFPDGSTGWFELGIQPASEGIFILSLDITNRIEAEKALNKTRRDWENIFQAIGQPSVILDKQQKIISANRAVMQMTNKSLEELIGIKCCELFHETTYPPKRCPMKKILSTGCLETEEMEIEAFGGTYLVSCTPVFNNNGILEKVIHIATDISQRKQHEKELDEYQKRLKLMTSELLLAEEHERHRIAAGIHDDIGQRLAIIKFGLDSLKASESRTDVLSSLKRQSELVEQAIENTRSFTFELSNLLLYEIGIEAAIETWLIEHIKDKCGIKCEFTSRGPQFNLNEDIKLILFQAVKELLTNIIKHAKANHVEVRIVRSKNKIRILVIDNGIGFVYTSKYISEKGMKGFGLFNIRERLEYLGGNLEIQPVLPKGTRVIISVPIKPNETKSGRYCHEDTNCR